MEHLLNLPWRKGYRQSPRSDCCDQCSIFAERSPPPGLFLSSHVRYLMYHNYLLSLHHHAHLLLVSSKVEDSAHRSHPRREAPPLASTKSGFTDMGLESLISYIINQCKKRMCTSFKRILRDLETDFQPKAKLKAPFPPRLPGHFIAKLYPLCCDESNTSSFRRPAYYVIR